MKNIKEIFNEIIQNKLIDSIIVIIISFILYRIFHRIITRAEKNTKIKNSMSNKGRTYFRLIISIVRYIFIIITALIVLQINGINVSSMLAGIGILSVIIGLAIQDALKDIIRGFSILSDNYFSVGDIIKYGDIEGKVLIVGLKTTKIKDIKTGNEISIANRNIEQVEVVPNYVLINIPLPYEITVERAEEVIKDIINLINQNTSVKECNYLGVNELASSSINYLLKIETDANIKLQVKRDALRTILLELEKNNISIPYNQIDVHIK